MNAESGVGVKQWTARRDRDNFALIPPLAEEFSLYGGPATTRRARQWALDRHYLLADGIPACAHGLYLLASCPGDSCRNRFRQLDHASIWVPHLSKFGARPILLAHPYAKKPNDGTRTYANAHGLDIAVPLADDYWYGDGTIPIPMAIPDDSPVWPIEARAAILLTAQPVTWPGEAA